MIHNSALQRNISLAPYTTFGIGGPADFFFAAKSPQDIIKSIEWASEKKLEFFVLGLGANILVGDKGFRGLVIKNEASSHQFSVASYSGQARSADAGILTGNERDSGQAGMTIDDVFLTADSGITIAQLIDITAQQGLSGLEHFAGIPSTFGGALWQNLHFLSPDRKSTVFIGDMVESAVILACHSEQAGMTVRRDYFRFSYDYSSLHDTKDIVLSAVLRLTKENPATIQQRIEANLAWRKEKHPEYAWRSSAGSIFKKIPALANVSGGKKAGAGRIVDAAGLKGYQIGGAKISEKHANFIVNTGSATANDIRALIELVQKKVREKFNLDLHTEISFVGEF